MARISYGGGVFSPLRSDITFNDSDSKDEDSGRGGMSEDLVRVPSANSSKNSSSSLSEHNRRNLPLGVAQRHKNKKVESRSKKTSDKPVSNSNLVLITPCTRVENIDLKLPVNELPRKSKRLQKNEDQISKKETDSKDRSSQCPNKNVSSKISKKKGNDSVVSKFITVRGGEFRKTGQITNHSKSCSAAFDTPPEVLEEKADTCFEISNKTSVHDSGGNRIEETTKVCIKSDSLMPSNQTLLCTQLNEKADIAELKTSSITDNCELENMAEKGKINIVETSSSTDNSEFKDVTQKGASYGAALPIDPTQVQAKIIEKLITDTMNSEFDVIRQQLYLQQMSLLKVLNQTQDEVENRYSRNTETLYKIIEGLLEENRQLRSAILARR